MRTRPAGSVEIEPRQAETAAGSRCATVASLSTAAGSSILSVALPGGARRNVVVAARPDQVLARRLTAGFRRLAWVRIDLTGPAPRCQVSGTVRRPRTLHVPVAAALALVDARIPAVVRLPASAG